MRTTRRSIIPALLFTSLLAASLQSASAQAPSQPAQTAARAPAPAPAQGASATAPSAAEKPIYEHIEAFAKAFSSPDLKALAALFTDDASVVDSAGDATRGKNDVVAMYASSFEENPHLELEPKISEIRFITPDVVRVEGLSKLTTDTGEASEFTRFCSLLVKREGKWLVSEIREYPAPVEDVSSYDRLAELEWMVGDWVDESENVKATSSVRWADNKSHLIRTYQIEVKGEKASSGTMIVGWDPQTGQIKSWVFDSEGGHGEGLWTRTDEKEWVVKAHGVLRDGRPTSATQIHVVLNKDSAKSSSVDRIIGGEIAPDIADVVMIRKPPQPGVGGAQPQPTVAPSQPAAGASTNPGNRNN
jgi:uncharacterized protein (TIGR02246 family)